LTGLNAGLLDREIVIETRTSTQDESGDPIVTWDVLDSDVPAQWFPGSSVEVYRAQQRLEAEIAGIFRIYWRDDITAEGTRIVWDGKTFDVLPPIEGGRQQWLDIPVKALA
jgi:SPP1 family predicted phage head-tail adaptor